jgi:hypothetical protein
MEGLILLAILALFVAGSGVGIGGAAHGSIKAQSIGLVIIVLGCILLGMFIFANTRCSKQVWEREDPYATHTIVALSDGNEIEGKFRGSRNEKFMYVYGYKTYSGGMKIQKVSADNAVVYFRDDIDPCAKWYKETRSFWWCTQTRHTCDIFVPSNSLQAGITIDLQ